MKQSPTDRWGAWLEDGGFESLVSYTFVRDTICIQLRDDGFALPVVRSLQQALAAGLEALPTKLVEGHQRICCSFANVLNLIWVPVLEYLDSFILEAAPECTDKVAVNQKALLSEMAGVVVSADESMNMDKWIEFIKETLFRLLQVDVPTRLILQVMSPMAPFHVLLHLPMLCTC